MNREEKILDSIELQKGEFIPPNGSKSASFVIEDNYNDRLFDFLVDRFGIVDKALFRKKFDQAISGDGNEAKKMTSVRSSSLCALLFFYNVENKPVTFDIDGQKIKFDKSYFEVKNKVFNKPSNMDVVLVSERNEHILFLESKFAEYLDNSAIEISNTYLDNKLSKEIYKEAIDNKLIDKINGKYKTTKDYQYVGGLKQIISHYVGLQNYKNREDSYMRSYYSDDDSRLKVYDKAKWNIYFTEIVFKLKDFETQYERYHLGSMKLFEILRKEDKDIKYLDPIDYNSLFSNKNNIECISDKIKAYYKIK